MFTLFSSDQASNIEQPFHEDNYFNFIRASQDCIVRLDETTPSSIEGLCTSGLTTCIALIIYGNNGNISLMHISNWRPEVHDKDSKLLTNIIEEFKWIGNNFKDIYVIYNENEYRDEEEVFTHVWGFINLLDELLPDYQIPDQGICLKGSPKGVVAIKRNNELVFPAQPNIGQLPPFYEKRFITNLLNQYFLSLKESYLDLEYQGNTWTSIKPLCQIADDLVSIWDNGTYTKEAFVHFLMDLTFAPEMQAHYFFDKLRKNWESNEWAACSTLDQVATAIGAYREYRQTILAYDSCAISDELTCKLNKLTIGYFSCFKQVDSGQIDAICYVYNPSIADDIRHNLAITQIACRQESKRAKTGERVFCLTIDAINTAQVKEAITKAYEKLIRRISESRVQRELASNQAVTTAQTAAEEDTSAITHIPYQNL